MNEAYLFMRKYFIAGLVVWIPIWVTISIIAFILGLINNSLAPLLNLIIPIPWFIIEIPGVTIVIAIVILLFTGFFATNIVGQQVMGWGEKIVHRIPLIGAIYQAVKQMLSTLFSNKSQAFRQALLVEYPRKGIWSFAFLTNSMSTQSYAIPHNEMLVVFIPTTPNPTSGFIMAVPKEDVVELKMSVDEALKMVISLGVIQPSVGRLDKVME